MLAYNPKNITEDEREHLLTTVGQAHAGLAEVALKLRLGLPPKTPALKTAIKAERVAFDLKRSLQRLEAEALGFQRAFPDIGPANVKGLEINPYAAELARVSVWIGEIQWMRRNGFYESQNPILKPLDTIECRDAILAPDSAEPDWPKADVVIVADPKGVIVAGETRYKAAVSLGWTTAPVVTIPARQARAFRVIDNRTSELTSWDTDLLPDALSGLNDLDIFSFDDVLPLAATAGIRITCWSRASTSGTVLSRGLVLTDKYIQPVACLFSGSRAASGRRRTGTARPISIRRQGF